MAEVEKRDRRLCRVSLLRLSKLSKKETDESGHFPLKMLRVSFFSSLAFENGEELTLFGQFFVREICAPKCRLVVTAFRKKKKKTKKNI